METPQKNRKISLESLILQELYKQNLAETILTESAEFMSGALNYCITELLDISVERSKLKGSNLICSSHIKKAIEEDFEFAKLLQNTVIYGAYNKHLDEKEHISKNN
ncbi:hypothetical protein SteCoe_10012 [Stentor coeruleus]|uniref:Transcription factor CBF/NF-Y/archaeal histone domain-containing protein n=1 Tax=Stentor coeruleus TaxID=5963 RepID=A0A1R2CGF7_9CILI|nr:hypothetical protein SteCoe_10012 [Stentor coeruleus]